MVGVLCDMSSLTTTEKYALAQILVCGRINYDEFREVNDFMGMVQRDTIRDLGRKGLLDETLYSTEDY